MEEQGVSVATLAASVRIQRSTLENFCAGGPAIPSDVIERIANQLGTNPGYLRAISDEP
jgi:plasmid maintenance system antidote protein VapI